MSALLVGVACDGGDAPGAGARETATAVAPPPPSSVSELPGDTALGPSPVGAANGPRGAPAAAPAPSDFPAAGATGAPPRDPSSTAAPPPPALDTQAASAAVPSAAVPAPPPSRLPAEEPRPVERPFAIGERLTYEVRFGPLAVGTATMQVLGIEEIRGIPAYHTRFEVRGGNRLYRVQDRYESWFDTRTLASLRYVQDIREGNYERHSVFEIFPSERRFVEEGKEPERTVEHPLDEGSFLYWLRTIPLDVGQVYSFDRYFRPDRNPVRIEVLRRERIRVPAGTFDAVVVRPVIKTRGIFSEGGRAEIWFADDSTRRMLQMKSRLSFGSLNLYLK